MLQKLLGFDNYLFLFSVITIGRLKNNRHEQEFLYFLNHINSEGLILDIGANIGITVVPLAQKYPQQQVYAFEPVPANLSALKRIIRFFRLTNVRLFEVALGNCAGELHMVMPVVSKVKMQGLSHVTDNPAEEAGLLFNVPVKVLDQMEELQDKKIAAIKIDVENFEFEVLSGGADLLRKNKPFIYCELWNNEKKQKTIDLLEELGYKTMFFQGKSLVPYTDQSDVLNYFFKHSAN